MHGDVQYAWRNPRPLSLHSCSVSDMYATKSTYCEQFCRCHDVVVFGSLISPFSFSLSLSLSSPPPPPSAAPPSCGAKPLAQNAQTPPPSAIFSRTFSKKYPSESRGPLPPSKELPVPPCPSPKAVSTFSFFRCPCVTLVLLLVRHFSDVWETRDENDNFAQKHDVSLAKDKIRPSVVEEIRNQARKQISCFIYIYIFLFFLARK